jgi:bacterioferritin
MKGDIKVIEQLNNLLAGELTAMDQYFIHSRMYEDWGFNKLYGNYSPP